MQFNINESGLMNTALFTTFGFLIFEIICSSVNEELFNYMHLKIQKISESKLIQDQLEE